MMLMVQPKTGAEAMIHEGRKPPGKKSANKSSATVWRADDLEPVELYVLRGAPFTKCADDRYLCA